MPNTLEGQLVVFNKNNNWIVHEVVGDGEGVLLERGREEADLQAVFGQVPEDVLNFLFKTSVQHFIRLIEDEQLEVRGLEFLAPQQFLDLAGRTYDDLRALLQPFDVLLDGVAADEAVDFGAEVLAHQLDNVAVL